MFMWPPIKLTHTLAQTRKLWLTIDASGRITRLPLEEKHQDKRVFHYRIDVTTENVIPFPLAEMVTTNNKATNIKSFLSI